MGTTDAIRVAMLGCGVVGAEVAAILAAENGDLAARVGAPLELVGIAVRDIAKDRPGVDRALLTTDADALARSADIVVEVMGGIEPARSLMLAAISSGASVVTANKALLAEDGPTLYAAADAAGVDVYYEAAVAGAIPLVRPVRESLAGDRIKRVLGIVNGTTNYVLDKMATEHLSFDQALAQAQRRGYAEADPTADIEGHDAAAKAAILASLAFHSRVSIRDVHREGIDSITAEDVAWAAKTGHAVKLLAIAERYEPSRGQGDVEATGGGKEAAASDADRPGMVVRVHPALVPLSHPLATVRGAYNAVVIEAEAAGRLMFYGRGAGGVPTASAVLGDVVSAARHRVLGGRGPRESSYADVRPGPLTAAHTRYSMRLAVADRPGVLAQISQLLADEGVSIETVRQAPRPLGPAGTADLLIGTHAASDGALAATVRRIAELDVVIEVESVLRVEGED